MQMFLLDEILLKDNEVVNTLKFTIVVSTFILITQQARGLQFSFKHVTFQYPSTKIARNRYRKCILLLNIDLTHERTHFIMPAEIVSRVVLQQPR